MKVRLIHGRFVRFSPKHEPEEFVQGDVVDMSPEEMQANAGRIEALDGTLPRLDPKTPRGKKGAAVEASEPSLAEQPLAP